MLVGIPFWVVGRIRPWTRCPWFQLSRLRLLKPRTSSSFWGRVHAVRISSATHVVDFPQICHIPSLLSSFPLEHWSAAFNMASFPGSRHVTLAKTHDEPSHLHEPLVLDIVYLFSIVLQRIVSDSNFQHLKVASGFSKYILVSRSPSHVHPLPRFLAMSLPVSSLTVSLWR